jgi:ribosome-associated protein
LPVYYDRMPSIPLRGEHITLVQAVKVAGLAESGGQAKFLIREGHVTVNDRVASQPGRKLVVGDRIQVNGGEAWIIAGPE